MNDIIESTKQYEKWLREQTDVSEKLIERKHRKMGDSPFEFLRATFYRWVELWPEVCPQLAGRDQDVLLAVGDLHTENFGTWRDSRERLVWGMNDFDEACELPLTSDLVRLGTSAILAVEAGHLTTSLKKIFDVMLKGYRACLKAGGKPVLLGGGSTDYPFALPPGEPEEPGEFWKKKLDEEDFPVVDEIDLPPAVVGLFRASFPVGTKLEFRKQKKPGGLGSLGRHRFTAVTGKKEERVAREVKALVPSALYWVKKQPHRLSQTASLLQRAIRDPDPYFLIQDQWMLRQLAPDAIKIKLDELPAVTDGNAWEVPLFQAMGWETANIHLGSRSPRALGEALDALASEEGDNWLSEAAEAMVATVREDFKAWPKT